MLLFNFRIFGEIYGLEVRKQGCVDLGERSALPVRGLVDDDISVRISNRICKVKTGQPMELVGAWLNVMSFQCW